MITSDKSFFYRAKHVYLPAIKFTGMSTAAVNEAGAASHAYGVLHAGSHTGAPRVKEISTLGFNAVLMEAAGDMVATEWMAPGDFAPDQPWYLRVVWTSGSTDVADTVTWIVTANYATRNTGQAISTPAHLPGGSLADDVPVATAYALCKTEWCKFDFNAMLDEYTEHQTLMVEMDAIDAGLTEDVFLLGLEIAYTPTWCPGVDSGKKAAERKKFTLGNQPY